MNRNVLSSTRKMREIYSYWVYKFNTNYIKTFFWNDIMGSTFDHAVPSWGTIKKLHFVDFTVVRSDLKWCHFTYSHYRWHCTSTCFYLLNLSKWVFCVKVFKPYTEPDLSKNLSWMWLKMSPSHRARPVSASAWKNSGLIIIRQLFCFFSVCG